jgi:hypothetical protein
MPNRLTDTNIWKRQRWFKNLPPLYKLAWKYLTDMCDHAGIWKIDMAEFLDDTGIDDFDLEDFIVKCNQDFNKKTGKIIFRQRAMKLNDAELWLTGFIAFQYSNKTTGSVNLHFNAARSAIKIIDDKNLYSLAVDNKFFSVETTQQSRTVADSPEQSATLPDSSEPSETVVNPNSTSNSNSKEVGIETTEQEVTNTKSGEKKIELDESVFNVYSKSFDFLKGLNGKYKKLTVEGFTVWKEFVDFVYKEPYSDLLIAKFVFPQDFEELWRSKKFTKDKWKSTIEKILATGVKPEHNLFFRIPQFMEYGDKRQHKNNSGRVIETVSAGGFSEGRKR